MKLTFRHTILAFAFLLAHSIQASDFGYHGPQLHLTDYQGSIFIHNSHLVYPHEDILNFRLHDHLKRNHPRLMPLRSTIDTWAAQFSIHPKFLARVVSDFFRDKKIDDSLKNKQIVWQIAAAINSNFNASDSLSASQTVYALSKAFDFELTLDNSYKNELVFEKSETLKGGGPPLFGYFIPPWPVGESWSGGGAHTNTGGGDGPRGSLDFFNTFVNWGGDTSNDWVSAAQSGTARVWSSCSVSVIHPNGWTTTYYHLDNVQVTDGQTVFATQKLAIYADNLDQAICNGGFSTGPHLHFTVRYNSTEVEINHTNVDFTYWNHNVGEGNYDSNCSRSYYNLLPSNSIVCPFNKRLPNKYLPIIFKNGFE